MYKFQGKETRIAYCQPNKSNETRNADSHWNMSEKQFCMTTDTNNGNKKYPQ